MEPKTQRIRATAYKVPIKSIIEGKYVKEDEEFSPNYIELGNIKISRANIIGIIVSKEENETGSSLIIDDNTAKISIRSFEQSLTQQDIKIGDIINIIGRPREFGSEKYIVPEIIKKTNEKWMRVRKLELEKIKITSPKEERIIAEEIIEENKNEDQKNNKENILGNHEKIIQYIKDNDQGKGVETEEILKNVDNEDAEKLIGDMLREGILFENMPGRLKVLE